jgi:hypothetical protein
MTVHIYQLPAATAYDLLSRDHFTMLSDSEREIMQRSMANSAQVWIGEIEGKVVAVWGLMPPTILSDIAYLWLYATKDARLHMLTFIRQSRGIIKLMLDQFPTLVGHCKIENLRGQRWLRWLGAEFGDPINGLIYPFTIRAK